MFTIYSIKSPEHEHVTDTDGYYRSGYNHEPLISQAVNVEHRTDPDLTRGLNPGLSSVENIGVEGCV